MAINLYNPFTINPNLAQEESENVDILTIDQPETPLEELEEIAILVLLARKPKIEKDESKNDLIKPKTISYFKAPDHPIKRRSTKEKIRSLFCKTCGATESSLWRRGPNHEISLCNACGLRYAKALKKEKLNEEKDFNH